MLYIRVRYFRGRVLYFDQSEARKMCFLAFDWLKFETLPRKTVLYNYRFQCSVYLGLEIGYRFGELFGLCYLRLLR